ncbi:hypothetical protein [Ferrimonas lipolytica]|uniref:Uncharacterized protein n=1 Tax=Ferrimonas lipolytica TaxID=2724191 RepID=A0A6H1UDD7_9GAMM|nr:hypothetical protein [Ferrimonas lipolytica]QIZ76226.1 hypothetical protein HER31_04540 [Ferrimonas lipolytica]
MSNSSQQLSAAQRALIASALLGGGASAANQWGAYQRGEISINELTHKTVIDAAKAGLAGGVATKVATNMAGRPALSLATVLLGGAAALYLMDDLKDSNHDQTL